MKVTAIAAILLVLPLCACTTAAGKRAAAVSAAAPYLSDALSQPMATLYNNAVAGKPEDLLRFGLALAAGRPSPVILSDSERVGISNVEMRLQAAEQAWLQHNPPGSEAGIPWNTQIGLTSDEAMIIWRDEQATSADYWLSAAENATTVEFILMPVASPRGGSSFRPSPRAIPAIDHSLLLTATACALAVRNRAGLPQFLPVPEVIHRLRSSQARDIGAEVTAEAARAGYNGDHGVGPAACGDKATLTRYVRLLTSTLSQPTP